MAEQKLGSVTYVDRDKTEQPVSVGGVTFKPGEAVDVDKMLPADAAERLKQKLAGNHYFKVEGGPDHAKAIADRAKADSEAAEKRQQVADKQGRAQQQPPPDWKAPEKPTLEHSPSSTKRK